MRSKGDLARYILHRIIWAQVFKSSLEEGYARLKSEYLRRFFPDSSDYALVMNRLIKSGVIECNGRYVPGAKCLGYRLSPEWAARRHVRVEISDHTLRRKIVRHHAERPKSLTGVHRYLFDHLRNVRIDAEAALDAVGSLAESDASPIHETAVWFIQDGQFRLETCRFGRVHTNLTNLKRELRRFLHVDGRPLVNLDIRNSQPLVFASILKDRFEFDPGQTERPAPPDVVQYVELVQAGRFYDHVMAAWEIPAEERSSFKKRFFERVFYCKSFPPRVEAERFGAMFPTVLEVVRDLKKDDYRNLAHSLQRAESRIMIEGVAARCMREMPGVFLATIHDSVLCTAEWAEAVRACMMEEFEKAGLVPTVNIDDA
jgi:hypothetical protein